MPTSNNPPNWSKVGLMPIDSPFFHFHSLLAFAAYLFFAFPNYKHLAEPPSTSISYLFYNPLCIPISFLSLSLNLVCMCCDICGVFLVYPSESKRASLSLPFPFPLLPTPIYCSLPCTDRQCFFAPPFACFS